MNLWYLHVALVV